MSYLINKYRGDSLVVLEDGTVDLTTSLGLVGRNYVGYGEIQNENFIYLLENFAGTGAPLRPLEGQLWYNTAIDTLHVYDGEKWVIVGSSSIGPEAPPDPHPGQFWLKSPTNILYVFNGTTWILVGPDAVEGFDTTRAVSGTILDNQGTTRPVIRYYVNGVVTAISSSSSFIINSNTPEEGYTDLVAGLTFKQNFGVKGDLQGTADFADRLATPRNINNITFDGSQDITIRASTTQPLVKGSYLTGNNFDGSTRITWDVDASTGNLANKVVARDAGGNFSAGTISADLIGNVTGQVTHASGISNFDIVSATEFRGATLSGNAFTASRLQTSRKINDVSFDGSTDVTVPASAYTLTQDTINPTVIYSSLQSVGVLTYLNVDDSGIEVGSGQTLRMFIDTDINNTSTIKTTNTSGLTIGIRDNDASGGEALIKYITSDASLSAGGERKPSIIPLQDRETNIGHSSFKFNTVYANSYVGDLIGNADTATLATSSNNLTGGGAGSVPYQTASGNTSFISTVANKILRSDASGIPYWGDAGFASLISGNYLIGSTYTGLLERTWSVDASSSNTGNKVVARDSNGDFASRYITADRFIGPATELRTAFTNSSNTFYPVFVDYSGDYLAEIDSGLNYTPSTNTLRVANITGTASGNVKKTGDTMTGRLTLSADPTNNLHAATKRYVDNLVAVSNPYYAGRTSLANVIATYVNYPTNTRVSFYDVRSYAVGSTGNGGRTTITDWYRRTVKKNSNGTWTDIGG